MKFVGGLSYLFNRSIRIVNDRVLKKWGSSSLKKVIWDKEFSNNRWDFLEHTSTDPIYHYLEKYLNRGNILDLGCGSSNTGNEMDASKYCSYTGVDISERAIQRALVRSINNGRQEKNEYFCADIASYVPRMRYDVILFRESIYYIPKSRIKGTLDRYFAYLKESGVFIVRISNRNKYNLIVRLIEKSYEVLDTSSLREVNIILVFK